MRVVVRLPEVPPARPRAAAPASQIGPSPAMLKYMEDLARRLYWTVPPEALRSRQAASEFIDIAKAAQTARGGNTPAPPNNTPTPEPPTAKQIAYAQSIASRKKLTVPSDVLLSKKAMSTWIDANR